MSSPNVFTGGCRVKGLTGGIGPTVPLWSLKLALAFYRSGTGLATARVAAKLRGRAAGTASGTVKHSCLG
jgi:hypothetical protein